ncbi:winged helix-turn-helix domain-containing protein [Candidatus Korarchaeum cryptofilum]|uniref:Transcriptional regulator, ArsR family n=1 Tax=Korarchaeum cryptofilum (strain OPF8) TaxID=374847 RepID=B1L3B7_KORCO|nr:winged helix-turn-helix domain-containing protein [Candidatus Korarchaeum cryptofilum]ACB06946.1 transcriptional regulator, ArsR family [Candidatus Korarchaeum cryptofilum OPF8]
MSTVMPRAQLVRNALTDILGATPAEVLGKTCSIFMRVVESSQEGDIMLYLFGLRLGEKLGKELGEVAQEDSWSTLSEIFTFLGLAGGIEILTERPRSVLICVNPPGDPEKRVSCSLARGIVLGFTSMISGDQLYVKERGPCPGERGCLLELTRTSEDVLMNPIRRAIVEYLRVNQGAHMRQISRDLGISLGSLRWHLDVLERKGIVREKRKGNMTEFYLSDI